MRYSSSVDNYRKLLDNTTMTATNKRAVSKGVQKMIELTAVTTRYNSPQGELFMAEQELPKDNERMALSDVAKLLGCSDTVLQIAARAGKLPTAKKMGYMWTVEYGPVRDWWNREKHPGGRPKKTP